jgi:hypothetical protein
VLLYLVLFALLLDRPLALGWIRQDLDAKLARAAAIRTPKLVILAGSNGPYSHRCEAIEPILHLPCVNGGIALGIGLDYLFARWRPMLHAGDIVYLPMEEAQYARSRGATVTGPDAALMLRHDRATLRRLSPARWAAALFANDLRSAAMAPVEMALATTGFHDARAATVGGSNAWGDHVGHTAALGAENRPILATATPWHASADAIRGGYGATLIAQFLRWARANRVQVIGGFPTEFADSPMPDETAAAIRSLYIAAGAEFLELPDRSQYPRSAFFDTPDHLNEPWQITHSVALAHALLTRLPQRLACGAPTIPPQSRAVPPCPPAPRPASAPPGSNACCPAG